MTNYPGNAVGDPYRYGVYLRPDPRTCLAVTTVTTQLRAQYGLVSAGAFPPHATLAGTQHLGRDEGAIIEAVTAALAPLSAFTVHNAGIRGSGTGFVYDVHHLADGRTPNEDLVALAVAVDAALGPLRLPAEAPQPHLFDRSAFVAHLSLASHDLYARGDLHDEVRDYIHGLGVEVPADFPGDTVALYRTRSDDWSGRWWRSLSWEHLRTWKL